MLLVSSLSLRGHNCSQVRFCRISSGNSRLLCLEFSIVRIEVRARLKHWGSTKKLLTSVQDPQPQLINHNKAGISPCALVALQAAHVAVGASVRLIICSPSIHHLGFIHHLSRFQGAMVGLVKRTTWVVWRIVMQISFKDFLLTMVAHCFVNLGCLGKNPA